MIKTNIKIFKKRTHFRKQCKEKYCIKDNRLCYKYYIGNNIIKDLYIPFQNEEIYILHNIHISNLYPGIDKMKNLVVDNGLYWEGYSSDIKKYIRECPKCSPKHNTKKIKMPFIDEGPHYR